MAQKIMHPKFSLWMSLCIVLVCSAFVINGLYAVLYLDPSFGATNTGVVTTNVGSNGIAYSPLLQTDGTGRLVLVGSSVVNATSYVTLACYSGNGILDTTFGTSGILKTTLNNNSLFRFGAIQPTDGYIVVAGYQSISGSNAIALARFNPSGAADTSFGGGVVTTPYGDWATAYTLALQADGSIVAGGSTGINYFPAMIATRYAGSNGSLDSGFGTGGYTTKAWGQSAIINDILVQPDDQYIVTAGVGFVGNTQYGVLGRYDTTGQSDAAFGTSGFVTTAISGASSTSFRAIGLQTLAPNQNKIVVLAQVFSNGIYTYYLARYTTAGVLDPSFNPSGSVPGLFPIDPTGLIGGRAMVIDASDRIVVAGFSGNSSAVMRFTANADASVNNGFDATFGNNGIVITQGSDATITGEHRTVANGVLIQPDGRIVVAGAYDNSFFAARYFDSNADAIFIDSPSSTPVTIDNPFTISGSATEAHYTVKVYLDTVNLIATTTTDAFGHWSIGSLATTTGAHTIKAELLDGTGAVIATTSINITVNAGAASISIASPVNGATIITSNMNIYGGSNQQGYQVQVLLDDVVIATVTTDSQGQWNIGSWNIPVGSHTIVAQLIYGPTPYPSATNNFTVSSLVGPIGATGTSGMTGLSGLTGESGITGLSTTGITGATGTTGLYVTGATGESGITGFSGITGDSGVTGTSGVTGFSGQTGESGVTGQSGITGISGRTGVSGITGESGTTGFSGMTGDSGVTGTSGVTGYSGQTGESGITGQSGITGSSGSTGVSGFTGRSGSTGISGITGFSGTTGVSGFTGPSGITGFTGSTGGTGFSGMTGRSGVTGFSGNTGLSGLTGRSGVTGFSGGTGITGVSGVTGYSGYTGSTGMTGATGFSSATGATGLAVTGQTGMTGTAGAQFTTETITTVGGTVSPTTLLSEIAQYSYATQPPVYTMDDATDGSPKVVALANNAVSPIQLRTNRGSIIMEAPEARVFDAIFNNDHWVPTTNGFDWFVDTQQAMFTGAANQYQGWSVALSADGNTLAEGGYGDNSNQGAVWVFTRSGTLWSQQVKLVGLGQVGAANQGYSVALSADGNTLAEGGYTDDTMRGAVWVFTRSGTTWSQQGSKLVGSNGATGIAGGSRQGVGTSLSFNGDTLAVAGGQPSATQGGLWVFTRSGTQWSQQGNRLTGLNGPSAEQMNSVAISGDGNTIVGGIYGDSGYTGAIWIFTRSGTVWAQQGNKLTGSDMAGPTGYQGRSVAISVDGNTIAEGGYGDNNFAGAVWIFTRTGTVWGQQGSKLTGLGVAGSAYQGYSVALSADGNILIECGTGASTAYNNGGLWLFARSGNAWNARGGRMYDSAGATGLGTSVDISADGNTAVAGAVTSIVGNTKGGFWVFV